MKTSILIATLSAITFSIIVLVFILAGFFSWIVGFLVPEEYHRVPYMLIVCLAAPLFYTLSETTVVGLSVTRKSHLSMFASLLAFSANVFGNYLLVPSYGAEGAAISTAISFWLFFILRTEFAIYVWLPIKRLYMYSITLMTLGISILFMIYGSDFYHYFTLIWLMLLLCLIASNIDIVKFIYRRLS